MTRSNLNLGGGIEIGLATERILSVLDSCWYRHCSSASRLPLILDCHLKCAQHEQGDSHSLATATAEKSSPNNHDTDARLAIALPSSHLVQKVHGNSAFSDFLSTTRARAQDRLLLPLHCLSLTLLSDSQPPRSSPASLPDKTQPGLASHPLVTASSSALHCLTGINKAQSPIINPHKHVYTTWSLTSSSPPGGTRVVRPVPRAFRIL